MLWTRKKSYFQEVLCNTSTCTMWYARLPRSVYCKLINAVSRMISPAFRSDDCFSYMCYSSDRGILEDIFQQTRLLKLEKKVMIINRI